MDAHRLTLLHFSISGLALLNELSVIDSEHFIDFIYGHQIHPSKELGDKHDSYPSLPYDSCHVTTDYSALVALLILGDDLGRVNRQAVVDGILALQTCNGNLMNGSLFCPEFDARFIFSAVASAYILDKLDQLNLDAFEKFFVGSITYEGAFGKLPKLESHAGITYCALASLKLMNRLDKVFPAGSFQRQKLINWLLSRQRGGFNGRSQKEPDTCYTFWVGASLKMLDAHKYVEKKSLLEFVCSSYDPIVGGFMRSPDASVDLLHSYMTLAGLSCLLIDPLSPEIAGMPSPSLSESLNDLQLTDPPSLAVFRHLCQIVHDDGGTGLEPLVPELNLPLSTFKRLKDIHAKWRSVSQS
ncbi:unnamed protein product [Mesocestoides corti]|uniref:Prenyltransferase alpha-alpha toroid domain-containing protein n=1 Tax=Mesocestoides corti TaxID=53468 RepID=A0A0R3U1F7_MESCO|nr:unnamed protein product [Mesocestoides corti]